MGSPTAASTNWAIYSVGGNSALGGNTRFGGVTAPTNPISVTGNIDVSGTGSFGSGNFSNILSVTGTTNASGVLISATKSDYDLANAAVTQYPLSFTASTGTGATLGAKGLYAAALQVQPRGTGTQTTQMTTVQATMYASGTGTYNSLGILSAYLSDNRITAGTPAIDTFIGYDARLVNVIPSVTIGNFILFSAATQPGNYSYVTQGTITNAVGLKVNKFSVYTGGSYTGVITNAYGIYLATQTDGGTNWQIYSVGGNSAFGGNTRFGGVTAPVATVDVTGTVTASGAITGASFSVGAAAGQSCDLSAGGTSTNGVVTACGASDERYKKDVATLTPVLDKLVKLRGVTYYWNDAYLDINKGATKDQQIGMVAQEVQKEFPDLVAESSNGTLSIKYALMPPLLLQAVKELNTKIDDLSIGGTFGGGGLQGVNPSSISASVKNALINLGVVFDDVLGTITNIVTDKLTAKTAKVNGLELVDSTTGETYCTWIAGGEWQKAKGNCSSVQMAVSEPSSPGVPTQPTAPQTPAAPELQQDVQVLQETVQQLEQQNQQQQELIQEQVEQNQTQQSLLNSQRNKNQQQDNVIDDLQQQAVDQTQIIQLQQEVQDQVLQQQEQVEQVQQQVEQIQQQVESQSPAALLKPVRNLLQEINPMNFVGPLRQAGSWLRDLVTFF